MGEYNIIEGTLELFEIKGDGTRAQYKLESGFRPRLCYRDIMFAGEVIDIPKIEPGFIGTATIITAMKIFADAYSFGKHSIRIQDGASIIGIFTDINDAKVSHC